MKLEEHYFTLFSVWGPNESYVPVSSIAEQLNCSPRHAKTIVKQLQANGWVDWKPGRGRGNSSKISFKVTPKEIEKEKIQSWIERGHIKHALKWLEDQPTLEEPFVKFLENQFQWTPSHISEKGRDVLSYPYYRSIKSLIPWEANTRHEGHLCEHVFNRLLIFDEENKCFTPELAYHWESFENGRVWRLYLRKGVYFHDGSTLTSTTIENNIRIWRKYLSDGWKRKMLYTIEKTKTTAPNILDIYLKSPNQLFLHLFTDHSMMIIPPHVFEKDPERFRSNPTGCGPYEITSHTKGHLILEAHNHFYGYRPQLDRVELYEIPQITNTPQSQVDYRIVDRNTKTIKHYDWYRPEVGGTFIICNQQKQGIHTDNEFRSMLSKGIDRAGLFQDHPYHDVWFPDSFFDTEAGALRQQTNIDQARKWMKDKGYQGAELTLTSTCLAHNAYFGFELKQLKKAFKKLGLVLHTNIVDIHDLATEEQLAKTDMIIAGFSLGEDRLVSMLNAYTSPYSFIYNTIPPQAKLHLDAHLISIYQSESTEMAYTRLRQLESFLLDNHYLIFLYQRQVHTHIEADERLQGVEINRYNRLKYDKLWYKY